jgi:hypothetical protein
MSDQEVAAVQSKTKGAAPPSGSFGIGLGGLTPQVMLAWLAVGVPLAWGVYVTISKALPLFR